MALDCANLMVDALIAFLQRNGAPLVAEWPNGTVQLRRGRGGLVAQSAQHKSLLPVETGSALLKQILMTYPAHACIAADWAALLPTRKQKLSLREFQQELRQLNSSKWRGTTIPINCLQSDI